MNLSLDQKAELYKGLGIFRDSFRGFIITFLKNQFGSRWDVEVRGLFPSQVETGRQLSIRELPPDRLIDFPQFKPFALKHKQQLLTLLGNKAHSLPTWLDDVTEIRHKIAHFDEVEKDYADRAWINMRAISRLIGDEDLENELEAKRAVVAFSKSGKKGSRSAPGVDKLLEAEVRRHPQLSFKVNSGDEHRIMSGRFNGSLWIRPRYSGYRVATTGAATRIDDEIARLVGPPDNTDNKGYKYWYLDTPNSIDKIIEAFAKLS